MNVATERCVRCEDLADGLDEEGQPACAWHLNDDEPSALEVETRRAEDAGHAAAEGA